MYQASAPPATYPTSAPPATGLYQASAPPATNAPASGPPAAGIYQAAPPPATGVYQASVPSAAPPGPHYSDLVTMPGDAPPQAGAPVGGDPGVPTPPAAPKSKRGLILGLVVVVVVFLLAVAGTGIVVALNNAGSTSFAVNSCVKQDGDSAKKASCSDKDAFTIVQKVEKPESCSDASQPYIVLQHKGQKDEVLCLRPAAAK
ncbi:LppU/SCO3897 family protein [Dactylosporangium cerinum]